MRFLSLFSGIGGNDLALERAGMTCVGQCENDPFCRLVLEKHWPRLPRWNDIRNFRKLLWERYCRVTELDPLLDLICGGFPCQDISLAGYGNGLEGSRSKLWWEFYRVVRELLPRWLLVENVPALRTRGADTILSCLESLNYACWSVVVGGRFFQPHQRNRVFIVAESSGSRLPSRRTLSSRPEQKVTLSSGSGVFGRVAGRGGPQHPWEERRIIELPMGRSVDGVRSGLVRLNNDYAIKAYGNSVVPDVVQSIGEAIFARDRGVI